jgi:mono/diheme cytochrome c family protein
MVPRRLRVVAALTAAAAALSFGSACPQDLAGDIAHGREIAERMCASCHVVGRRQSFVDLDLPLAPDFKAVADGPVTSYTALFVFLYSIHPSMPNIILSPEDANDVVAYIMSLRGP